MRTIIAVVRNPQKPGCYWVSSSASVYPGSRQDVSGSEAAAALAVSEAIRCGNAYHIFSPAEVVIPDDMRSRP